MSNATVNLSRLQKQALALLLTHQQSDRGFSGRVTIVGPNSSGRGEDAAAFEAIGKAALEAGFRIRTTMQHGVNDAALRGAGEVAELPGELEIVMGWTPNMTDENDKTANSYLFELGENLIDLSTGEVIEEEISDEELADRKARRAALAEDAEKEQEYIRKARRLTNGTYDNARVLKLGSAVKPFVMADKAGTLSYAAGRFTLNAVRQELIEPLAQEIDPQWALLNDNGKKFRCVDIFACGTPEDPSDVVLFHPDYTVAGGGAPMAAVAYAKKHDIPFVDLSRVSPEQVEEMLGQAWEIVKDHIRTVEAAPAIATPDEIPTPEDVEEGLEGAL